MKTISISAEQQPGFQIAPMIDVVFVTMLFFMVMAGAVKTERELAMKLPGPPDSTSMLPEEVLITIAYDGAVAINDEVLDPVASKALPSLTATMSRLKHSMGERASLILVTIQAARDARYERVIDVLNALAKVSVSNVTFSSVK